MKPTLPRSARRFLNAVLVAGCFCAAAEPGRPEIVLTAVRFWSLGDVTRVAIETTAEVQYHAERIEHPDRIFVDLVGVRRHAGARGIRTIAVEDKLIRRIRVAETQPGVTRVVIDLACPVDFVVSQLTAPDRLMLELRLPGSGPAMPPERSVTGAEVAEPETAPAPSPARPNPVPVSQPAAPAETKPVALPPEGTGAKSVAQPATEPAARAPAPVAASSAVPEPSRSKMTPKAIPASEAAAARRDSRGEQSLIRALGLKLERVVIDPGHGGHDTGTIGPGGLNEKDLVLDVAKRLGELISQRLGSEVIYTRTDDTFIPLEARTALANEKKADLFLSLHANSSRARSIAGSETYYLNFTTSASELDVAARENATSDKSIFELQDMLQKIVRREKAQESREFADTMQKALYKKLWRGRAKDRGVKKAPFVVLIGANMPSILAEIDFLSNPREERLLKRKDYRRRVAEALYSGVSQYVGTLSHFQVATADRLK